MAPAIQKRLSDLTVFSNDVRNHESWNQECGCDSRVYRIAKLPQEARGVAGGILGRTEDDMHRNAAARGVLRDRFKSGSSQ